MLKIEKIWQKLFEIKLKIDKKWQKRQKFFEMLKIDKIFLNIIVKQNDINFRFEDMFGINL